MDKCQCQNPGFCEFFKQEMTYDPPNWQWCRDASPQDREKYKISCDKKQARKMVHLGVEYITIAQLIIDCQNLLLPQISNLNLRGVVGIPRSGMLPASMLALWLNLPLYTVNESGNVSILSASTSFGGRRMKEFEDSAGQLLVVEDTVYSGRAIESMRSKIKEDVFYAAVYVHPKRKDKVDFFARELLPPHLLEWNLFNSTYIEGALLDFDGILSPNVPHAKCQNEEDYIHYIKNVKPFYHRIPKTHCRGIVTARLEKYRSITEDWLGQHAIKYGFLKMYPTEKEKTRNKNHVKEAASFKSKIFAESDAKFFIESETAEAVLIREETKKLVICPSVVNQPTLDLIAPIELHDHLPTQKSDIAICTIPANKIAMDQLNVTRKNIVDYAERCGADYIELQGDQAPDWPMYNKYRLKQVIEKYEHTLYLDCDVIVKEDAPNVYKTLNANKLCFVDEWDIIRRSACVSTNDKLFRGMQVERSSIILEYPLLAGNNRSIQPNGGVMLFPKHLAHRYSQPSEPYAKRWCFDQDYLLLNLEDDEFETVDWRYNLEFIDFDFWSKIEDAYFVHLNGARPINYRIELLKRVVDKNYSFFPQPPPSPEDCHMDRFRPNWKEACVNK